MKIYVAPQCEMFLLAADDVLKISVDSETNRLSFHDLSKLFPQKGDEEDESNNLDLHFF